MLTIEKQFEREKQKVELLEKMIENRSRELFVSEESKNRYQAQLLESSKMAALGEMAGGIAHEINNPVAIILLRIHHIKVVLEKITPAIPLDENTRKRLIEFSNIIYNTSERISSIVQGLRFFARAGESDPLQISSLTEIIKDTLALCHTQIKDHGIEITLDLDDSLKIPCRSVQISQVLLNIISNASYELSHASLDKKKIHIRSYKDNQDAFLTISDNGRGISSENLSKIMQPFFTTKPIGEGTGLGLSVSKGIIESHKGKIVIESRPGDSCFKISLPLEHKEESK